MKTGLCHQQEGESQCVRLSMLPQCLFTSSTVAAQGSSIEAAPREATQAGAQLRGGLSAPKVVDIGWGASQDQLATLVRLPHNHIHTPLLCCRLPLQG